MNIRSLNSIFENDKTFHALTEEISGKTLRVQAVVPGPLRPFILAQLFKELNEPIFCITHDLETAQVFARDMENLVPDGTYLLPDWEILPHERISPGREIISERLRVLHYLKIKRPIIAVSAVQTAMRRIPGKGSPLIDPIVVKRGEKVDPYKLFERLVLMGYERVYKVEARAQFSARGGIIDIFAASSDFPVRMELFGDEIDSLRTFSISTQRSIEHISDFEIFSCREVYLDSDEVRENIKVLKSRCKSREIMEDIEKLEEQQHFAGIERYTPFLYKNLATVLDFVPQDGIVVLDDEPRLETESRRFLKQQEEYLAEAAASGEMVAPPTAYFLPFQEIQIKEKRLAFSAQALFYSQDARAGASQQLLAFKSEPVSPILGKLERLRTLLLQLREEKFSVVLIVNDEGQAERLNEILSEWEINSFINTREFTILPGSVQLMVGDFSQGFVIWDKKFALLSHSDIFFKTYKERRFEAYAPKVHPIRSFAEFRRGDYVVHVNHGIAVYGGIITKEVSGVVRDYMILEYAEGDKLFVPIDQADRVSKYIGADLRPPKVHRLTSTEWARVKKRVKKSVKELAFDLYNLYAERARAAGFTFSSDTVWQAELEEAFPFEETRSQLEATADVKHDMEQGKPMDRLVCGDVGYGKTEVAMRAAFKAVMDEKQVMILVPTTILAEQHFKTIESRFAPYPVIIEELSRFKSPKRQKEVIIKFREGKVDILIGTHRLLQKDVQAHDLGLLVIDEEQRFGVAHKEYLKNMKKSIDALTLTATPIPRTLQMSLSGARDISIMDTPPENRYPISTYVGEFNKELIRNAVRREIARGGQVYYVHNRVESIDGVVKAMCELVPNARCAIAHGQMSESALEKVMNQFLQHRSDVLVCTTIIESGIDIPTANTLVVDMAERLGLSTLYQLRGRVGRAHHQAYAYFFFSPQRSLTTAAFERLKTIGEFTELGSGLKIALRDLEIRGAGNLLGPEQHGRMADVGFELYCQMLNQAVQEIKGEKAEKIEVRIELPVSAYIPHDYIEDEALRTEAYQRLSSVATTEEAEDVAKELQDRYGVLLVPVESLMDILRLKIMARKRGITNIGWERRRLILYPMAINERELSLIRELSPGAVYQTTDMILKIDGLRKDKIVAFIFKLFNDIIV